MPDLLQLLKPYASDTPERIPNANIELRWPGMLQGPQDIQYRIDTPGAAWQEFGPRRAQGSSNPRGPTDPTHIQGFKPYPISAAYKGETPPAGTPMNLTAPRPFTEVSPHPPIDTQGLRWNYHTGGPDVQSSSLATSATGSTPSRNTPIPTAWNPHFERLTDPGSATLYQEAWPAAIEHAGGIRGAGIPGYIGALQAPPTMEQYAGELVADHLPLEEFKTRVPAINPGNTGTLIIHGLGFGVLAKAAWVRDFWANRFLAEGLEIISITNKGLSDFIIRWKARNEGMRAGPILIGALVIAILLVLGWLSPRLSMFLERTATGIGKGALGIGAGVAIAALALAFFARSSKRGLL